MADDGVLGERKDRDREICRVWNEKKAVQIGFTKVALGKFIDQMTRLCILQGKMYEG